MNLRPRDQHEALQPARQRPVTDACKPRYAARAGSAGAWSQGVRALGRRYARYRGLAKTHVPHSRIAMALTMVRVVAWVQGLPRATTRQSSFARLVASLG
ncbi:MAG: transposase [Chloroflexales bacterium]|nr:transposase [Chloroflexales bacterium]